MELKPLSALGTYMATVCSNCTFMELKLKANNEIDIAIKF